MLLLLMKRLLLLLILVAGCRSVEPVRDIRPAWSPNISRLMLLSGKVVQFDADLGWYDKKAGIIEGMTSDSQHVTLHLAEIGRIETVRSYEVVIAVLTGLIPLGLGIYILAKLLQFV